MKVQRDSKISSGSLTARLKTEDRTGAWAVSGPIKRPVNGSLAGLLGAHAVSHSEPRCRLFRSVLFIRTVSGWNLLDQQVAIAISVWVSLL